MTQLPHDQHITYQFQFRKCGKASCSTCREGQGHGPYWYAYWREDGRDSYGEHREFSVAAPAQHHPVAVDDGTSTGSSAGISRVRSRCAGIAR